MIIANNCNARIILFLFLTLSLCLLSAALLVRLEVLSDIEEAGRFHELSPSRTALALVLAVDIVRENIVGTAPGTRARFLLIPNSAESSRQSSLT